MKLSDKKRNRLFYLIQVLGWGSLNCLSILMMKISSIDFILYSLFFSILLGVFPTSLLRWYIKKYISFNSITITKIVKICIATLIASSIYGSSAYFSGFLTNHLFDDSINSEKMELMKRFNGPLIIAINSIFIMFGWVTLYLVIKFFMKLNADRIERLQLQANLKESQLNTLKGQINPHFMFNSLNNIRGLMLEDVDKSRDMLTRLSDMLRYSLTKNSVDTIELSEELEMVDNYISLSKIQLENRLVFETNITPEALEAKVPPMIVQMLIENAVKHGVSELKEGGEIRLNSKIENENLYIGVINSGKLSEKKSSTKIGLKNIEQRLSLLYGDKASFALEEIDNEVVAQIKIPLS